MPSPLMIFILVVVFLLLFFVWLGVRLISNKRIGIVEKKFGGGSVGSGLIALQGQAGFQADVLRGGLHWFMPSQYTIHVQPLVTITKIWPSSLMTAGLHGPTQVLASNVEANNFEDVRGFLQKGALRAARQIPREGTYAINLAQFIVITEDRVYYLQLRLNRRGQTFLQDGPTLSPSAAGSRRWSSRAPTT